LSLAKEQLTILIRSYHLNSRVSYTGKFREDLIVQIHRLAPFLQALMALSLVL
jgi:hypothetical protein